MACVRIFLSLLDWITVVLSVSAMFCLPIRQGFPLSLVIVRNAACMNAGDMILLVALPSLTQSPFLHECPRRHLAACLLVERGNFLLYSLQ